MKFYTYMDNRTVQAPFGVISGADLHVLLNGKVPERITKTGKLTKAHTLGRNGLRFYLFLLTRASGRKPGKKGYQLSQTEIERELGLNKSSIYEALNDLLALGLVITYDDPEKKLFCLNTPKSEISETRQSEISDQNTPKQSEISDYNQYSTYGTNNHNTNPLPLNGDFIETVRKIISTKPVLLLDRLFGSDKLQKREDNINAVLKTQPEMLINRLTRGKENSLLRSWGYEGSQRKRTLILQLQTFLATSTHTDFELPEKKPDLRQKFHPWVHQVVRQLVKKNHGLDNWASSDDDWVLAHIDQSVGLPPADIPQDHLEVFNAQQTEVILHILQRGQHEHIYQTTT